MSGVASVNGKQGGLEDVVAVRTRLSDVDGEAGKLVIAGYRVEELAANHGFEEICHLLWFGYLPTPEASMVLRARIGSRRVQVHRILQEQGARTLSDPMDALRAVLARFGSSDDLVEDAITMVAAAPVANSWWWNVRGGSEPPTPDAELSTAADYLRMIANRGLGRTASRALEQYLVTVSDHGVNASTFTARIIASTRSDLVSAVVGAIGALKGPLHGGAPGPVLEMLDAIGSPQHADEWLRRELEAGRRIMGMGHRVYRVRDPRAAVFERAVVALSEEQGGSDRLDLARSVERTAEALLAERHPRRSLKANVEFYTAVLLESVGIPRELFTATFAVGRMAGWTAHIMEQRGEDRMIRPQSRYVGPGPA
jgi:citrate synthase